MDISPFLAELAHETGCFESGDPAADSYDNVLISNIMHEFLY